MLLPDRLLQWSFMHPPRMKARSANILYAGFKMSAGLPFLKNRTLNTGFRNVHLLPDADSVDIRNLRIGFLQFLEADSMPDGDAGKGISRLRCIAVHNYYNIFVTSV